MHRAHLFLVTALLEVGTGVSLLVLPSVPLALLLGVSVASPETLLVARVAGAALSAIGVACWLGRGDSEGSAQLGLLTGILIYDVAAAALLAYSGLVLSMAGIALWPAVVLHTALAVWCVACLWVRPCGVGAGSGAHRGVEGCEEHGSLGNGRRAALPTPPP
jgi:hypothetical protein